MKLGRNDKCYCGSGKKYKKCHLIREYEEEVSRKDIADHSREISGTKYCSVPDSIKNICGKKVIKAHTISKSSSLKSISKNGHVMGIKQNFDAVEKNNGVLKLEKMGVNIASTFTGFCSEHDRVIFSPIENDVFIPTKKNCFLLAYRPFCREIYAKRNSIKTTDFMKNFDKGHGVEFQKKLQSILKKQQDILNQSLMDLGKVKAIMDNMLITDSYDGMSHYVFEFDGIPKINASGSILPEYDFNGDILQTLKEDSVQTVIFNCLYSGDKGYFIFSWIADDEIIARKLIESLISKSNIPDRLVAFLFSYCENVFCEIDWWDNLSNTIKNDINTRIMLGVSPFHVRDGSSLSMVPNQYDAFQLSKSYYM